MGIADRLEEYADDRGCGVIRESSDALRSYEAEINKLRALLVECETTFAMWEDVAPAISLRVDIFNALKLPAPPVAESNHGGE